MPDRASPRPARNGAPADRSRPPKELRWLGLEPYREEHRGLYHGREEDAVELRRLVRGNRFTLLIGKMGSGKTSLLRADFLPGEEEKGCLAVYVRPDPSSDAPLGQQVQDAIHEAATSAGLTGPQPKEGESLWEYLHLADGEFWTKDYRIVLPMIVLDQFENVLTQGSSHPGTDPEAFLAELADLVEGRVPKELRRQVLDDPPENPRFAPTRHHYKIIASLREESLADLDRYRRALPPELLHNRCRLTKIDGAEALDVITKPGSDVVDERVAERIVRKVAGGAADQARLVDLEVEPAILSVFCRWLDDRRVKKGMSKITQDLLDEFGDRILLEFYEDGLRRLPGWRPKWFVHRFIEGQLIVHDADSGAYVRRASGRPEPERIGWSHLTRPVIEELESRHIVRIEAAEGEDRVQLSHDVLIEPVRQSGRNRRGWWLRRLFLASLALLVLIPVTGGVGYTRGEQSAGSSILYVVGNYDAMATGLNRAAELVDEAVATRTNSQDFAAAEALLGQAESLLAGTAFEVCEDPPESPVLELSCGNRAPLSDQIRIARSNLAGEPFDPAAFNAARDRFNAARDSINALMEEILRGSR